MTAVLTPSKHSTVKRIQHNSEKLDTKTPSSASEKCQTTVVCFTRQHLKHLATGLGFRFLFS